MLTLTNRIVHAGLCGLQVFVAREKGQLIPDRKLFRNSSQHRIINKLLTHNHFRLQRNTSRSLYCQPYSINAGLLALVTSNFLDCRDNNISLPKYQNGIRNVKKGV